MSHPLVLLQRSPPTRPAPPRAFLSGNMLGLSPETHAWARDILTQAWAQRYPDGPAPTLQALQSAQSVALLESGYGKFEPYGSTGARNWGSVQCGKLPTDGVCPCQGILWKDTRPNSDGTSTPYEVCFRAYDSDVDGAADLLRHLGPDLRPKTFAALQTGDAEQISAAMYDERYYQGFGATREARIEGHIKAITKRAEEIAKALGEPLVVVRGGTQIVTPDGRLVAAGGSSIGRTVAKGVIGASALAILFLGARAYARR